MELVIVGGTLRDGRHLGDHRPDSIGAGRVGYERMATSVMDAAAAEVSVLTAAKDAAVLAALEAAGLTIDSVAKSANVIVGLAPIERLDDIALVDAVRKVEPVH